MTKHHHRDVPGHADETPTPTSGRRRDRGRPDDRGPRGRRGPGGPGGPRGGADSSLRDELGELHHLVRQIGRGGSDAQRDAAVALLAETRRALHGVLATEVTDLAAAPREDGPRPARAARPPRGERPGRGGSTRLTVTRTESLVPGLRRVWFHSEDLSAFASSDATDRYVKLVFARDGGDPTRFADLDLRAARGTVPDEELPVVRTYTALFPDVEAGTLAIDFVLHGDEGVAGPWAAAAEPGDVLLAKGPGGGYRPDPSADWYLLVGDEAALPAVLSALDVLPDAAVARVLILVQDEAHEPDLAAALGRPLPAGVQVGFVHRAAGGDLLEAVREMDWPEGVVDAFVHGEAEATMKRLRPYLIGERGVDRRAASISGYWREGRTEDGFRDWKRAQADDEGATR
ncbi:siderophore-interacting protein [Nocardioides bruguierae]|uniref:Siderophore-interacting protein n=1 Tax=Nocardioides bruguierae TaxID=2945102 RepID=A0A9X2D821_9ACTN|nr:siderophore-interacting protein [Nocardioides bruguierae]MCM0620881.1 siderophore-interacting protein [Nocardioides bruguierae]